MTLAEALERLGLAGSEAGPEEIRRAYLRLLKQHKPESDPEGFKSLREAFERARSGAGVARRPALQDAAIALPEATTPEEVAATPSAPPAPEPSEAAPPRPELAAPRGAPPRAVDAVVSRPPSLDALVAEQDAAALWEHVLELARAKHGEGLAEGLAAALDVALARPDQPSPPAATLVGLLALALSIGDLPSARYATQKLTTWLDTTGEGVRLAGTPLAVQWSAASALGELGDGVPERVLRALARSVVARDLDASVQELRELERAEPGILLRATEQLPEGPSRFRALLDAVRRERYEGRRAPLVLLLVLGIIVAISVCDDGERGGRPASALSGPGYPTVGRTGAGSVWTTPGLAGDTEAAASSICRSARDACADARRLAFTINVGDCEGSSADLVRLERALRVIAGGTITPRDLAEATRATERLGALRATTCQGGRR